MRTLLFSMLLACGESEDSGQAANNEQTGVEFEDPKWFEAGTYSCVSGSVCGFEPRISLTRTGTISDYELVWTISSENRVFEERGECLIGEAITPDESVWEATCEGLGEVTVYSEGFRIDIEWDTRWAGTKQGTFE